MTGNDVKQTRNDLGLTHKGLGYIVGATSDRISGAEAGAERGVPDVGLSALSLELLAELCRYTTANGAEKSRELGQLLAKGADVHGPGYAAWCVLNARCGKIHFDELNTAAELKHGRTP